MVSVRKMRSQDVERVAVFERQVFSRPWSPQGFLDALALENTFFLVAEEHDRILGYAGMYCTSEEGEITNVAVSAQERCRGVGGMMLDEIKREAGNRLLERVILEVRVSNDDAVRLYERKGFVRCGIRRGFYDFPKEDAYILIWGQ